MLFTGIDVIYMLTARNYSQKNLPKLDLPIPILEKLSIKILLKTKISTLFDGILNKLDSVSHMSSLSLVLMVSKPFPGHLNNRRVNVHTVYFHLHYITAKNRALLKQNNRSKECNKQLFSLISYLFPHVKRYKYGTVKLITDPNNMQIKRPDIISNIIA